MIRQTVARFPRALARLPQIALFTTARRFGGSAQVQADLGPAIQRMPTNGRDKFKGPVTAIVLDWSGTVADAHTIAPTVVFKEVFERAGCPITGKEAREPMGIRKDLHIKQILEMPSVAKRWQQALGRPVDLEADVAALYADFIPRQLEVLDRYSQLLPGCAETLNSLQAEGYKIGATTGFSKAMVDILLASSIKQGYTPDTCVAGDEVENNMGFRPAPFMLYQNLRNMGAFPIESVVKVDDCCSGVNEGINAGCWAVGVSKWSNYTGVESLEEWEGMSEKEQKERQEYSKNKLLTESGAHYVCDSIADLPKVVEDINRRLAAGEKP